MTLTEYLKGIADAIRENKKTTDPIPAENFQSEIEALTIRVDTTDANATSDSIVSGSSAYVNGEKVYGSLSDMKGTMIATNFNKTTITPINDELLAVHTVVIDNGKITANQTPVGVTVDKSLIVNAENIKETQIKKDVTILGVVGTYEGDFSNTLTPEEYNQVQLQIKNLFGEEASE